MKKLKYFGFAYDGKGYMVFLITKGPKNSMRKSKMRFKTYEEAESWGETINQRITEHLKRKGVIK